MSTIQLTDALGLTPDGHLADGAKLPAILPSFARLADLPLDQVPITDASAKLSFTESINVPAENIGLQICPGIQGCFALIGPKQCALDENDPFNTIEVKDDEIYVALALTFSPSVGLSGTVGSTTLGFSVERDFEIHCYRRFQKGPAGFPKFGKALAITTSSFFLPREVNDLNKLQADTVVVLVGSGTLTLSAGVSVSLTPVSLASVSAMGATIFQAKTGAEVGVNASVVITGGYQVRLRRLEGHKTELGVYWIKSKEADLGISTDIGVPATVGSLDLGALVIGALSQQPTVDVQEFQQSLPGEDDRAKAERILAFQTSIKAAILTKLQASIAATFATLGSHEAAWLFAIDSDLAGTDQAKAAITSALGGKFDSLTRRLDGPLPGIQQITNVFTDTDLQKLTLKVNLLGLANLMSVGKVAKVSTVERNANGDITLITDTANASRLQALLINFGNNHKRLRKLLSENFLIEAAYRAKDVGVLSPSLKAKHTCFEIRDNTSRDEMKNNLDVARVFGLIKPDEVLQQLGQRNNFGRTDFYAEARYTSDTVRDAFLKPMGTAPSADQYESAGRSALAALLMGDEGQELRKRVATDDDLWKEMKRIGNPAGFPPLFGLPAGSVEPQVEAAGADFIIISSWAEAMVAAGQGIQQVDELLGAGPVATDDPRLIDARERLKDSLADVVKNTGDEFGEPLGMVMFYVAANQNAGKTVILTGDQIKRLELTSGG